MNNGTALVGTEWIGISDRMEFGLFLSGTPPRLGSIAASRGAISWVYTVDLDQLVFTIDNSIHFDLFHIPRGNDRAGEWIRYMALDGRGYRCLKPGTPSALVPNLNDHLTYVAESISKRVAKIQGHTTLREMNVEKFNDATSLMMFQECTARMAKGFIASFLQDFGDARNHHPSTATFQEKAAFLLSLLAPGFYNSTAAKPGLPADGKDHSFRMSTSPRGTIFRFRSCLIIMTSYLDYKNHLQAHIGDVLEYIDHAGLDRATVIIWSVLHVAVVKVTNSGGVVEYTPVLPVLAAFQVEDSLLTTTLRLVAYHLSPDVLESNAKLVISQPR